MHTLSAPSPGIPALTPREEEVVLAWFAAASKARVARQLRVSEDTVRSHITNVRQKYLADDRSVSTKSELLLRFIEDGRFPAGRSRG